MKALAGFVMRGQLQAVLAVSAAALLSIALPIFGLIGSAALALVTLRQGPRDGALVAALAGTVCAPVCWLWLGSPWPALTMLAVLWVPTWGLAWLLRFSRSLAFTAQAAGIAGGLSLVMVYALAGDPAAFWSTVLEPLREMLVKDGLVEAAPSQVLFAELARWMTGVFAAAVLMQLLIGLFIGRWWQALLYNPGGFGADFRTFRLHPLFGVLGLVLLTLIPLMGGPGLVRDLLILLVPLWLLQGLAVIHQIRVERKASVVWLVGLYLSLVFFMPHAELLVACVGLVDIWADIRARLGRRPFGGA